MIPIFEIPEMVDLSVMADDKSHSMSRKELTEELKSPSNHFIPGKKVLSTLLERDEFNPRTFCQKINDVGLDEDQKILGLKAKERAFKEEGRYFCLMSSEARDYFVFTEYLIKKDFLPLFDDITMSDSLHTLMHRSI